MSSASRCVGVWVASVVSVAAQGLKSQANLPCHLVGYSLRSSGVGHATATDHTLSAPPRLHATPERASLSLCSFSPWAPHPRP